MTLLYSIKITSLDPLDRVLLSSEGSSALYVCVCL